MKKDVKNRLEIIKNLFGIPSEIKYQKDYIGIFLNEYASEEELEYGSEKLVMFEIFTEEMIDIIYKNNENFNKNLDISMFISSKLTMESYNSLIDNKANKFKKITISEKCIDELNYFKAVLKINLPTKVEGEKIKVNTIFRDCFIRISEHIDNKNINDLSYLLNAYMNESISELNSNKYSVDSYFKNNNINKVENITKNKTDRLENIDITSKLNVKVFCVGQANSIVISNEKKEQILFDGGIDIVNPQKYIKAANSLIKNVSPKIIIISHWHLDHYNLLNKIDDSKLECIIISKMRKCTFELLRFLNKHRDKIINISINCFSMSIIEHFGFKKVKLFLGENNKKHGYYDREIDDSGILLYVGGRYKDMILPGDCSYYSWPANIDLSDIKILQVPHHGLYIIENNSNKNMYPYRKALFSNGDKKLDINHNIFLNKVNFDYQTRFQTCEYHLKNKNYILIRELF